MTLEEARNDVAVGNSVKVKFFTVGKEKIIDHKFQKLRLKGDWVFLMNEDFDVVLAVFNVSKITAIFFK